MTGRAVTGLWTAASAAAAIGVEPGAPWAATGVSIDSRSLAPGDLFVALSGPNHDGHDFVLAALAAGAAAALVERPVAGLPPGAPVLPVADTLGALEALGRAGRRRAATVIGITGSVGKTGTRSMLQAALAPSGATVGSRRSLNNQYGVPLTLARIPSGTRYAVLELGMSAPGEILRLARLARPDVAVITAIAPAHLETLGSLDRIARAKAEILAPLAAGATAILPAEGPGRAVLAAAAAGRPELRVLTFGEAAAADAVLLQAAPGPESTRIRARILGRECVWRLAAAGRHWARNSLAVQLALGTVGADPAPANRALAGWQAPAGRGAAERVGGAAGFWLIDDSYNANPASMAAALARLAEAEPAAGPAGRGRRVAFLGDMLELGPGEEALHAELASLPCFHRLDAVHLCGRRMRALHRRLPAGVRGDWVSGAAGLADRAPALVAAGDVVLVKGSNAFGAGVIASALRATGDGDDGGDG